MYPDSKSSWAPRRISWGYGAKLGLGFRWAVYRVWSGPNWVPASKPVQLGPRSLDIEWMCGLNWAWVSGLFTGYEWVPTEPTATNPVGSHIDIVWVDGLNGAWLSGPFTGYGVSPNWAPANRPSWAPPWILCG